MLDSDVDAFIALSAGDTENDAPFSYGEWMTKLGAPPMPRWVCWRFYHDRSHTPLRCVCSGEPAVAWTAPLTAESTTAVPPPAFEMPASVIPPADYSFDQSQLDAPQTPPPLRPSELGDAHPTLRHRDVPAELDSQPGYQANPRPEKTTSSTRDPPGLQEETARSSALLMEVCSLQRQLEYASAALGAEREQSSRMQSAMDSLRASEEQSRSELRTEFTCWQRDAREIRQLQMREAALLTQLAAADRCRSRPQKKRPRV